MHDDRNKKISKKSIIVILKIFFRSSYFISAIIAVSIVASIFVTTDSISQQVYSRIENELPLVLGTQQNIQSIDFELYHRADQCIGIVNYTSFVRLTGGGSMVYAGERSGLNNATLLSLPSLLNYCLLDYREQNNSAMYLGKGVAVLASGGSYSFVRKVAENIVSINDLFNTLGVFSVAALAAVAWLFVQTRSKRVLRILFEQGLTRASFNISIATLALAVFGLVCLLSATFSIFIQNVSIGTVGFLIGPSLLFSEINLATFDYIMILSILVSFSFFIIFSARSKQDEKYSGKKGLSGLMLLVFLVSLASSITFLTVADSSNSLDYLQVTKGQIIIPANTVFPLNSFLSIPDKMNCSNYSAEIAYPAILDDYKTIVRGVSFYNSTYFYGLKLIKGSWPVKPYQIAIGKELASTINISPGKIIELTDQLTSNSAPFMVTAIYDTDASPITKQEALTTLDSAQAINDVSNNQYSYIRLAESCSTVVSSSKQQGINLSQLLARVLLGRQIGISNYLYAVYSGLRPLTDSLAVIGLAVAACSSACIWYASELFVSSSGLRKIAKIRWEQGEKRSRQIIAYVVYPAIPCIFLILSGELVSALIIKAGTFGSIFYQRLQIPSLFDILALLIVLASTLVFALIISNRRFED